MTPGEAMEVLGLVGTALAEMRPADVRAAWAHAVQMHHPDTAITTVDSERVALMLETLIKARDCLLDVMAKRERACKFCHGTGKVRGRLGAVACVNCAGTGDRL